MIRLSRSKIPPVLASKQADATQKLWDAWKAGKKIEADKGIYAHPDVKNALRAAQHDKCAYCETRNPTSHDVVEHYRPKNGWRQERGHALTKPQYFWLSYKWENLLFACDLCNDAGHKQNLFPLADPGCRATPEKPDISKEEPLLLDPYTDEPGDHIEWSSDIPRPVKGSRKGRKTIDACGLDKDGPLMDARRAHLQILEAVIPLCERLPGDDPGRTPALQVIVRSIDDSAPWAAMVRANLGVRIKALQNPKTSV